MVPGDERHDCVCQRDDCETHKPAEIRCGRPVAPPQHGGPCHQQQGHVQSGVLADQQARRQPARRRDVGAPCHGDEEPHGERGDRQFGMRQTESDDRDAAERRRQRHQQSDAARGVMRSSLSCRAR